MEGIEIERKWLVNADIFDSLKTVYSDRLSCVMHKHIDRAYLSMSPELRVSRIVDMYDEEAGNGPITPHRNISYRATIKTGTGIERGEVEFDITEDTFNLICHTMKLTFIEKEWWKYAKCAEARDTHNDDCVSPDHGIEVHRVIAGDDSFYYVEVEFDDIETAKAYEPKFTYTEEVTHNSYWKMQHVWERITQKDK